MHQFYKNNLLCLENCISSFKRFIMFIIVQLLLLICIATDLSAQSFTVNLNAFNSSPHDCLPTTIAATVTGGSGNYMYFWNADPPSEADLGDTPYIYVSPNSVTEFNVAVRDMATNQFAFDAITVGPLIDGPFNVSIPNAFTPNGDGINDLWRVLDANNGTGPINAYEYDLLIVNRYGSTVYSKSATADSGTEGLLGGQISWNGRLNGTGGYVSNGVYNYAVELTNCSDNQTYNGTITILGSPNNLIEEQQTIHPNPTTDYFYISLSNSKTAKSSNGSFSSSNIKLLSKSGQLIKSVKTDKDQLRIDVRDVKKGLYFLKIYQGNKLITKQVAIEK